MGIIVDDRSKEQLGDAELKRAGGHDLLVQQRNIDETIRGWYDAGYDRAELVSYLLVGVCLIADNYGVSRGQLAAVVLKLARRPLKAVTRTPRDERNMGSWWERRRMRRVNETHQALTGEAAPKVSECVTASVRGWHDAGYDRMGMIKSLLVAAAEIADVNGASREEMARVLREAQLADGRQLIYKPD